MYEPVAHTRLVYVARLWVADFEMLITAVPIRPVRQISVEREYVGHEIPHKLLHVSARALPSYKFFPCVKKIFD